MQTSDSQTELVSLPSTRYTNNRPWLGDMYFVDLPSSSIIGYRAEAVLKYLCNLAEEALVLLVLFFCFLTSRFWVDECSYISTKVFLIEISGLLLFFSNLRPRLARFSEGIDRPNPFYLCYVEWFFTDVLKRQLILAAQAN